jgi:hypothetical protein
MRKLDSRISPPSFYQRNGAAVIKEILEKTAT